MENPAKAASRLLLSTGLGLILVTGLALQRGLLTISEPNFGWLFPISGFVFIAMSKMMKKGIGPLSKIFPNEDAEELVERISEEVSVSEKHDKMGGAWAQLEASLLSTEIGEDE